MRMLGPTQDNLGRFAVDAHRFFLHPDPRPLGQLVCQPLQGPGGIGQVQTARPTPHELQQLVLVGLGDLGRGSARPQILQSIDPVRADSV